MNMKKFFITVMALLVAVQSFGQAKYVFLFIGDGLGANTVNFTQQYLGALDGRIGIQPLTMSTFPVCNVATTFSANSLVTDSAASGTAIATGQKTNNGFLGCLPDSSAVYSIAAKAKKNGRKVGVLTTVGVNHATPAAFYGHQAKRSNYDKLVYDMIEAGFDYYGGESFLRSKDSILTEDPKDMLVNAGYTLVGNPDDFKAKYKKASKILYIPDSVHNTNFAIDDATSARISLKDFVGGAVDFFMKDGRCSEGFFIMAEGGKIDYIDHACDAAGTIAEVIDFDNAVKYAYEFYLKHPNETAIIVTADHDTGGPALLIKDATLFSKLQFQKNSQAVMTKDLIKMMKESESVLAWDEVKAFLDDRMSLWKEHIIKDSDEEQLMEIYCSTILKSRAGEVSDEYGYNHNAEIVAKAVKLYNHRCGIDWSTTSHSGAYVPVFYIGPKRELFTGRFDNSYFFNAVSTVAKLR